MTETLPIPTWGLQFKPSVARFARLLDELGMADRFRWLETQMYGAEGLLELAHSRKYLELLRRVTTEDSEVVREQDTPLNRRTVLEAEQTVWQAVSAAHWAWREKQTTLVLGGGFHHARPSREAGFCILNGLAVAALDLLENHGVERIAILDTDAHAGDGTAEILAEDPRVLKISIHQDPRTLYPRWGEPRQAGHGAGEGCTVNIPLAKGAGWNEFCSALVRVAWSTIAEFNPQILFRTGGADMHRSDPLSDLTLNNCDFHGLGRWIRYLCDEAGLLSVEFLASGYNEYVQASSWLAYLDGRFGLGLGDTAFEDFALEHRKWRNRTAALEQTFLELRKALGWKWECLRELSLEAESKSA